MAYVSKVERDRREIARLRQENSIVSYYKPKWQAYTEAVEGGEAFAKKENLFRHAREHEKDYDDRARRLYYNNILEGVVSFFTDFMFSETILRDGASDNAWYQDFLKDVDKKGSDIEAFMREVSDDFQSLGHLYIGVDAPVKPEWIKTKKQEQEAGIRPYWIKIHPSEIIDYAVNQFDQFVYAKRMQMLDDFDPAGKTVVQIEKYTEWTPQDITVTVVDPSGDQPKILSQDIITNQIGEVPLVPVRFKRSKLNPFIGNSFIRDMVLAARAILNLQSLEDEFLYRQCFNILAMEAEESLPFKDQEEGESGTSNALVYPKGAKPPTYIAPSSEPADKFESTMQRIESQIFRNASQDMMNELFNGSKQSGFGKAMSFSKTVPRIASRADTLEKAETRLMQLTCKYRNKDWKGSVKYKDRYEITSLTDWLTQLTIVFTDLGFESPTFMKTQFKKLAHQFDGKFTTDEVKAIYADIDKIDFKDWFSKVGPQLQQQGGAKISPAMQQKSKQTGTLDEVRRESMQPHVVNSATKRVKNERRSNSANARVAASE